MNPTDDSRFLHLAMKAVAGKCAPEEQAEFESLLRANPLRAQEYAELAREHDLAAKLIPLVAAVVAPPMAVPATVRQRVRIAIESRRKAAVNEPAEAKPRVLSAKELETLVLKVLSERPMDGFELCTRLTTANIGLQGQPAAAIYRLLDDLEMSGHLAAKWVDRQSRRVKVYSITADVGWSHLRRETDTIRIAAIAAAILSGEAT